MICSRCIVQTIFDEEHDCFRCPECGAYLKPAPKGYKPKKIIGNKQKDQLFEL